MTFVFSSGVAPLNTLMISLRLGSGVWWLRYFVQLEGDSNARKLENRCCTKALGAGLQTETGEPMNRGCSGPGRGLDSEPGGHLVRACGMDPASAADPVAPAA